MEQSIKRNYKQLAKEYWDKGYRPDNVDSSSGTYNYSNKPYTKIENNGTINTTGDFEPDFRKSWECYDKSFYLACKKIEWNIELNKLLKENV